MNRTARDIHPSPPTENRADGATDLLAVIGELSFATQLPRVADIVRRAARRLSGADGATFVLRDGNQCYYADEDAIAPLWKGSRFPMTACVSGWVMLNGQAAIVEDVFADPRVPADVYRPTFVRSMAMVPVRSSDPIAAIGIYWAHARRPEPGEMRLMQALADATALALANVELYGSLHGALAREEAARREAEKASRAKDQFLMLVSHELRTPLVPVLGWASVLLEDPGNAVTVASAAQAIRRNAQQELAIIDKLLDLARIAAGDITIRRASLNVCEVVHQAIRDVSTTAIAHGVRVTGDFSGVAARILGDRERLTQVISGLIENAITFSSEGRCVRIACYLEEQAVCVAVCDEGIGLDRDAMPSLFEPFSPIDASSSRDHPGLGVELAIARHLIRMHGGTLEAHSRGLGEGSEFRVRLPLVLAKPAASGAPPAAA